MTQPSPEQYDQMIDFTIPKYRQLVDECLDVVVHSGVKVNDWIDVGSGTGNMVMTARTVYPDAKYVLLDLSKDMLALAKFKLGDANMRYVWGSSDNMGVVDSSADVVTCIQSNHYYDDAGHANVLAECHRILRPGGILITTENVGARTEAGRKIQRSRLKSFLLENGRNEEEAETFLDRYGVEYKPRSVDEHIRLLEEAGFRDVEVFWMSSAQIGLSATR
ncbi:MAG: class I SAM-dependent methyltransferase [Candidatus Methanomethylophilaceae archaeon]|nr:class I SAM-dependent methyltransferase [Candidatus Methanomethylophilaceae archaeon]MDY5871923.1 class I SAM-dependent methyltransferase [Candidatus Methanomethylophilaceae archaeon]